MLSCDKNPLKHGLLNVGNVCIFRRYSREVLPVWTVRTWFLLDCLFYL